MRRLLEDSATGLLCSIATDIVGWTVSNGPFASAMPNTDLTGETISVTAIANPSEPEAETLTSCADCGEDGFRSSKKKTCSALAARLPAPTVIVSRPTAWFHVARSLNAREGEVVLTASCVVSVVNDPSNPSMVTDVDAGKVTFACSVTRIVFEADTSGLLCPISAVRKTGSEARSLRNGAFGVWIGWGVLPVAGSNRIPKQAINSFGICI
eukprot:780184-Rhodomonas_salina.2